MEKTSPIQGDVFFTGDIHTQGHRDSMTESAKWADSVKTCSLQVYKNNSEFVPTCFNLIKKGQFIWETRASLAYEIVNL